MSENIREIVFDCLLKVDEEGHKSHLVIREVLDKYDYLDNTDKNFIKRLFEGTIQKRITLDHVINRYSSKPVEKCKSAVKEILRMGAYQILYMDRVPDSAVCDEAVKLCIKRSRKEFSGFVNAVLRKLSREKENALCFDDIADNTLRLSVKYSLPEWLVRMLTKEQKNGEELIASLEKERPTTVRITDDPEGVLKAWEKAGLSFAKRPEIENVYDISGFHGMESVPGFLEGKIYVQDLSSMISVKKAYEGFEDAENVLDICAAPGGKSMYMAQLLKGKGHITSCDISDEKVDLIRKNAERLNYKNIDFVKNDATIYNEAFKDSFDIVIADVPCSGLGVISRKSDIKYRMSNELMADIVALQKEIADNVKLYVKKGGVLLYSTCTIHKAENERIVKYITKDETFVLEEDKQFLPNVDDTDGFYYARLRRVK